jgi:hypothetical protein
MHVRCGDTVGWVESYNEAAVLYFLVLQVHMNEHQKDMLLRLRVNLTGSLAVLTMQHFF